MSLLDILTGMLGAFLFLMLGLLPYYAKVARNASVSPEELNELRQENKDLKEQVQQQKQHIADLQNQIEQLQKIVKEAAGGPLTAEQIQQLNDQMNQLERQVQQLRQELQQAQDQLAQAQQQVQQAEQQARQAQQQAEQARQQLDGMTRERDYWQGQQPSVSLVSKWDSSATDIDVYVISPSGKIYGQKSEQILGRKVTPDGQDSVGPGYVTSNEGLVFFLDQPGDYLVFYRVPAGADPATYSGLTAYFTAHGVTDMAKQLMFVREDVLPPSHAEIARPGGLYAWCVLRYDDKKFSINLAGVSAASLPKGLVIPHAEPVLPPSFPFAPSRPFPSINAPAVPAH